MEISPGIHRIDNVRGANSYLVLIQDTLLVVDTGMPGNAPKIVDYIKKLGREPKEVKYIVLTHADIDHSGSVAELKQIPEAKVAIHKEDAPSLAGERKLKEVKGILSPLFSMMTKIMKFSPVKPDWLLEDGDEVEGLKAIYTPGHTPGHISLFKPEKILFAGDALRSDEKGNPIPMSKQMTLDMEEAWRSVKKIAELDFDILLPGHGAPVIQDASKKTREMLKSYTQKKR